MFDITKAKKITYDIVVDINNNASKLFVLGCNKVSISERTIFEIFEEVIIADSIGTNIHSNSLEEIFTKKLLLKIRQQEGEQIWQNIKLKI